MSRMWYVLILATSLAFFGLAINCGGDECNKDADCKDLGSNMICKLDLATQIKKCAKQITKPETCPASCSNHFDCLNCPNDRVHCVDGVCNTPETPPLCPQKCTSDSDCAQCPNDNTTCNFTDQTSGICGQKQITCPDYCTSDTDCSKCPDQKTHCNQGSCGTKPLPTCPSSCKVHSDCSSCTGGNLFCVNGQCGSVPNNCPSDCTIDEDCARCPYGLTACIGGKCSESKCPPSCSSDADCTQCHANRTACINGACAERQAAKCPQTCTTDADCTQCPDGRTSCSSGQCQKPTYCPSTCSSNTDCAQCPDGKVICSNGQCQKPPCPTQCNKDADCVGCSDGKTSCTSYGVCGPSQCPTVCAADSECGLCPDGRTACVNNTCQRRASQCPSSCARDADCAQCPDGRTSCSNGSCIKPPIGTCPSSCVRDSDCSGCSGGRTSCSMGRCTTPSSSCPMFCLMDSECAACPGGRTSCVSYMCDVPDPCPSTCSRDSDCTGCGAGYKCKDAGIIMPGTCAKTPQAKDPCDSKNNPCDTGLACITLRETTRSYCFQICTSSTTCNRNTDGRTSCIPFATDSQGKSVSVCLTESNENGPCGFDTTKQAICKQGQKPPMYCSKAGTCKKVIVNTAVGDACNKTSDQSEPYRICDADAGLVCDDQTGKCAQAATANAGEACDPQGTILGNKVICASGLDCISFDKNDTVMRCHKLCDPQQSSQCGTGLSCMKVFADGSGMCMDLQCTQDSDCLFSGYRCVQLQGSNRQCYPASEYGQICTRNFVTCASGLRCLFLDSNAEEGFCTSTCSTNSNCTSISGKTPTCVSTSTDRMCVISCSNTNCPPHFTCQSSGSSKYCFPAP